LVRGACKAAYEVFVSRSVRGAIGKNADCCDIFGSFGIDASGKDSSAARGYVWRNLDGIFDVREEKVRGDKEKTTRDVGGNSIYDGRAGRSGKISPGD
jgi:hypothetical protein